MIGDARFDFASRMGARSIWHEAVGVITVYDAWSGEQLGAVERTTRARGIGDHNAGRKALSDLGKLIGEAVDELLRVKAAAAGTRSDRTAGSDRQKL